MKDSQHVYVSVYMCIKYIKESNERFSTGGHLHEHAG